MESLIGYGSDDDYDESSQSKKQVPSQVDVNYEEVQMDLSEDSNDSSRRQSYKDTKHKDEKFRRFSDEGKHKHEHTTTRSSPKHQESTRRERRSRDRDDRNKDYKKDRNRHRDDRGRRNKDERDDRRLHRGSSRERHRSRSPPRRSDYGKRSSSHERTRSGYSKRYDRASNKMDRLEKLGIELGASGSESAGTSGENMFVNKDDQGKNRFFMPGITGRFTEQIQRRKLLWQKKDNKSAPAAEVKPIMPQGQKVWQNTTFAQDTDGKVANKFKRLMGIKEQELGMAKSTNENLKKQEEMFTSMEAQYEVARTATHTMRGVGLGFSSFQR